MSEDNKTNADMKLDRDLNLRDDFTPPTYDEWKEKVIADLKGAPFDKKLLTKTYEGITLQPIYTQNDIKDIPHLQNTPGFNEYVRGTKASGYLGNSWEVAQELPYGLAEDFNEALKRDLSRGQTAINMKLDKPTKLGLDADYAKVEEVGTDGVSISGLKSLERALEGIDLDKHPLFIEAGFSSLPIMALLNAYLKKNGKTISSVKGSVECDPIGYLATEGSLPITCEFAYNKMKCVTEWVDKNNAAIKTIGVSGLPYHNAGASAVQELAFALATAAEYLEQMTERGLDINVAAKSVRFTFGIGTFYFMEIAKLRAAKLLWAKIVEAFGGDSEAQKITIHARTSTYSQTEYDPYVNMLRTTTEAFSAVVGGVDSLHTNNFDELFGIPDEFSRRIARNVQLLLKEESHLNQLIDPAGGSYYIESLTNEVCKETWKQFQTVEEKGGILETLKSGFIQEEIDKVVEAKKKNLSKRKDKMVGINMYANVAETKLEGNKVDNQAIYNKRAKYLQKFRVSQGKETDVKILEELGQLVTAVSEDSINIGAQAILDGATLGEISKAIRATAEHSIELTPLKIHRAAELFEELRDASNRYKAENGNMPKIFLANMGPLKQHKARADFSRGFFEVGGFEVIYSNGFEKAEDAAKAAAESGAKAVCICSTDDVYPEIVPSLTKGIKDADADITVILAGYPKDQIEAHKASGVDEFIFMGADVYQIVSKLLTKIGALK
ncbi:MAG: acyl-CoA mutase large subunit family protein [Melioribacteraceae bacterium]|nr:acyl-CoA mutase large subunit family protein [Melioribacteraceae bacterium]